MEVKHDKILNYFDFNNIQSMFQNPNFYKIKIIDLSNTNING